MNDKYLNFRKIDENETELFIYGDIRKKDFIDRWFGTGEYATDAFTLKDALQAVDTPNLTVRINSYGGSVSEGLAIYSLLQDFKGNVKTIVDGFACSAASVIFMAGDVRVVPESGLLMIHNAWSEAVGDSNAMRKMAEDLEKITQPSVNIYVSKTGQPESKIKEMMDRESWITSQEAFDLGFATTIEKNDNAKQSLESNYLYNMVMKIKGLEEQNEELRQKTNNFVKKDSWESFFNK